MTAKDCGVCDKTYADLEKVGTAYRSNGGLYAGDASLPTFFIKMRYGKKCGKTFDRYGVTSVPYIITSGPKIVGLNKEDRVQYLKPRMWHISGGTTHGTVNV